MARIDKNDIAKETYSNKKVLNDVYNTYDSVKNLFSAVFDGTDYEKYYKEATKKVDDIIKKYTSEDAINKVKDCAKDIYDKTYDGINKLIDELNKPEVKNNKVANTYNYRFFTTMLPLDNGYVIKLKHCNNLYQAVITKGDYRKVYNITEEEYNDIYALIIEGVNDDRLTFNSIMDVLQPYVDSRDDENQKAKEPKKTNPIQFCEFRKEDVQKEELKIKKSHQKFQVGELVKHKTTQMVGVVNKIHDTRSLDGKTRKLYVVDFDNGIRQSYFSYELEKAQ